jgi:hypothetical protein
LALSLSTAVTLQLSSVKRRATIDPKLPNPITQNSFIVLSYFITIGFFNSFNQSVC